MKIRSLFVGSLILSALSDFAAEPVKFGCAYYPEAWPEARWAQDIADMKAIGLTVVRVGEFNWTGFEPEEGRFDFAPYRRFLSLCEREGVDVLMCTPTATLPPWMTARYPETERRQESGARPPFGTRQNRCPSSPKFRFFADRIARRMAEAFRDFACIRWWQIDNELHINAAFDTCCCSFCARGFRAWLKARYGTLESLNAAWNHAFWSSRVGDWDEIRLPLSKGREPWQTEFVRFQSDLYVGFALAQAEIIRSVLPRAVVTSNGSEMSGRLRLDSLYRQLGFVATDTYVSSSPDRHDRARWMWGLSRGLTGEQKPFMVAEMGPFNWDAGERDADAALEVWVNEAIRHGASHILFFRWRQSVNGEQYHPAILPWSGRKGRTYRLVRELVARAQPASLPKSDIAIWHSNASDQDTLVRTGKIQFGPYEDMTIRLNAALEKRGTLPDYVLADAPGDLTRYRRLFIPHATIVSSNDVERLKAYVRAGGTLVSFARLNVVNPKGGSYFTEPYPNGMTDLFGLEINDQRAYPWKSFVLDLVEPKGCTVLSRFTTTAFVGEPLLTVNRFGAGAAYYCAELPDATALDAILSVVLKE